MRLPCRGRALVSYLVCWLQVMRCAYNMVPSYRWAAVLSLVVLAIFAAMAAAQSASPAELTIVYW